MKTLIEIHALQNFAPSNLNRDDTGAPKDAFFGGTRRARISSQCVKRAVREYFKERNKDWIANRTKRIVDVLKEQVASKVKNEKGFTEEKLKKAIERAVSSLGSNKKVKVDKDGKTDVLLFLSPREVDSMGRAITESYADLLKAKTSDQTVKKLNDAIDGDNKSRLSVDVALFGRMFGCNAREEPKCFLPSCSCYFDSCGRAGSLISIQRWTISNPRILLAPT